MILWRFRLTDEENCLDGLHNLTLYFITIFSIYTVTSFNVVSTQHGALLEEAEAWIVVWAAVPDTRPSQVLCR